MTVPGKAAVAGGFEAGLACFTDGFASSLVFVVGRDISDAGVSRTALPLLG